MVKDNILKNTDIIILSSVGWDWQPQPCHKLSFWLSACARRIIFIENFPKRFPRFGELNRIFDRFSGRSQKGTKRYNGLLKEKGNISIVTPFLLPSINFIFNLINRKLFLPALIKRIKKQCHLSRAIIFCFLPTQPSLDFINSVNAQLLVYYCTENFSGDPAFPKNTAELERNLIGRSDFLVCTSCFLYQKKTKFHADIIQTSPAVDFNLFNQADSGMISGPVKRVCYWGGINNIRIDFNIVKSISLNDVEVWLIGPVRDKIPDLPEKVKMFGMIDYNVLPEYVKECGVIVLPYNINEFTEGVIPAKLFECFASGKPIISTPLPDLLAYKDIINIASNPDEFVKIIRNIGEYETKDRYKKRIEIAREYSEDKQFNRLWEIMRLKLLNKQGNLKR